jgi:putative ABC transport system ATP-binding protein
VTITDQFAPGRHAGPEAVFHVQQLTKIYVSGTVEVHALRGIDLTILAGEAVVLLGPSGSGKSTLLNILGGLDRPTSGKIYFRDEELTALDDRALTQFRRNHVGFVFQFYNLIPSLTAYENVALVAEIADNPMSAREALAMVGLSNRQDNFPSQLWGGGGNRQGDRKAPGNPVVRRTDRSA